MMAAIQAVADCEGEAMTEIDWNQYRLRRQSQRNGGPTLSLGSARPSPDTRPTSVNIRIDCLHRYVKAQLLSRSTK
jgi:hypothetical protein